MLPRLYGDTTVVLWIVEINGMSPEKTHCFVVDKVVTETSALLISVANIDVNLERAYTSFTKFIADIKLQLVRFMSIERRLAVGYNILSEKTIRYAVVLLYSPEVHISFGMNQFNPTRRSGRCSANHISSQSRRSSGKRGRTLCLACHIESRVL